MDPKKIASRDSKQLAIENYKGCQNSEGYISGGRVILRCIKTVLEGPSISVGVATSGDYYTTTIKDVKRAGDALAALAADKVCGNCPFVKLSPYELEEAEKIRRKLDKNKSKSN
jgi:hypothetical protein